MAKTMKLFVWTISDTIVEYGTAVGFAPTKEEAIEAICEDLDPDFAEQLRAELQEYEPELATAEIHGFFSKSPT